MDENDNTNKTRTKRKPFRTYLAYRLMRMALWFDADWVQFASMRMTRERVEHYLRQAEVEDWDYEPEPEHITVTFH